MYDFHNDFRRAHITTLVRNIVCNDVIHDDKPHDDRPFHVRYREARKEMHDNFYKYLNASDTSNCYLSTDKRYEMFMDIVSLSID